MGILRDSMNNERPSSSVSKDENRQDGNLNPRQQDFEGKREEFRKYLERSGVIDALTKVLVMLYEEPEKPDDALEYMCKILTRSTEDKNEVQALRAELNNAKEQIAELESELKKCDLGEDTT